MAAKRLILAKEMNTEILPALKEAIDALVVKHKWGQEEARGEFREAAKKFHNEKVKGMNCHMAKMFTPVYIQVIVDIRLSL